MKWGRPLPAALKGKIALPFAIVSLIWGSTWLVIHTQLGNVPSTWSVCYRFTVAAVTMLVMAWAKGDPLRLPARDQPLLALIGVSIFALNFNFVYRAESHVTSGIVAVTFALLVVYNAVLGRIFLRQPLSRAFVAGSAVAMAGVALLFAHELRAATGSRAEVALGIGLTLIGMLFAAIANVLQGTQRVRALPMTTMLAGSMLWGAAANAAWAWASSGPPRFDWSFGYVAGVLYLGIVASALAFTLYFGMIRVIGPARGGYVNVVTPVIAMGLSTLFENYRWSVEALVGGLLVLAGLVVAMRARSPAR